MNSEYRAGYRSIDSQGKQSIKQILLQMICEMIIILIVSATYSISEYDLYKHLHCQECMKYFVCNIL